MRMGDLKYNHSTDLFIEFHFIPLQVHAPLIEHFMHFSYKNIHFYVLIYNTQIEVRHCHYPWLPFPSFDWEQFPAFCLLYES